MFRKIVRRCAVTRIRPQIPYFRDRMVREFRNKKFEDEISLQLWSRVLMVVREQSREHEI